MEEDRTECMVTVLYTSDDDWHLPEANTAGQFVDDIQTPDTLKEGTTSNLRISVHAWPLPTPTRSGTERKADLLVAGSGRLRAYAKHSSWLRDRRPLDRLKAQVRTYAETRH